MVGANTAHQRGLQLYLEMHQQGFLGLQEQGARGFSFNGPSAQRQNEGAGAGQTRDGSPLALAECGFAFTGEDLGNAATGFSGNHIIDIDKLPAETPGEQGADGAFARAHKAGQHDPARDPGGADVLVHGRGCGARRHRFQYRCAGLGRRADAARSTAQLRDDCACALPERRIRRAYQRAT